MARKTTLYIPDNTEVAGALPAASVALTKLATQADATIVGNNTGGAASPIALTAAQVRTLLALATVATSGSASDLGTGTLPIARVAAGDVTLAKLAMQADLTILGNNTGGAASPLALTATQVRTLIGSTLTAYSAEIDLTTTGDYEVIPPMPFRLSPVRLDWIPTVITNCTVGPAAAAGTNSTSFNNISVNATIAGFASGTVFIRSAINQTGLQADATTSGLRVKVNTGATATACKGRVLAICGLFPV